MQEKYSTNSTLPATGKSSERPGVVRRSLVGATFLAAALTGGVIAETGTAFADASPQPTANSDVTASPAVSTTASASPEATSSASAAPTPTAIETVAPKVTPSATPSATPTPEQGFANDSCNVLPLPVGCDSTAGPMHILKTPIAAPSPLVTPHEHLNSPELPHTGAPINDELALGLSLVAAGAISLQAGRSKQ